MFLLLLVFLLLSSFESHFVLKSNKPLIVYFNCDISFLWRNNSNFKLSLLISKYSMPFCLISNIILPRVNNFYIKQKKAWNICFIKCHQLQARSGKIKINKTQQTWSKLKSFFCKNWTTAYLTTTPSKPFFTIFVDIFFCNH